MSSAADLTFPSARRRKLAWRLGTWLLALVALVGGALYLCRCHLKRFQTVRPGEPPYRPLLRFQVHPDALRSYFHVYPLFENLRLPMTRENLDS